MSIFDITGLILMSLFLLVVGVFGIILLVRKRRHYHWLVLYLFGIALVFWAEAAHQIVGLRYRLGEGVLLAILGVGLFIVMIVTVRLCVSLYRSRSRRQR